MEQAGAEGSVTRWITDLREGDGEAAERLWGRYFGRMVALAASRLRAGPRRPVVGDEEDAALSAFQSLCEGAAEGRFDRLTDRDDLWKLLVVITVRKVSDLRTAEGRQKRGAGRVLGEADLAGVRPDDAGFGLVDVPGDGPTPEFAAILEEQCRLRLETLDDALRRVAILRMQGYSGDDIAALMGCARRTVVRKLDRIRALWAADVA